MAIIWQLHCYHNCWSQAGNKRMRGGGITHLCLCFFPDRWWWLFCHSHYTFELHLHFCQLALPQCVLSTQARMLPPPLWSSLGCCVNTAIKCFIATQTVGATVSAKLCLWHSSLSFPSFHSWSLQNTHVRCLKTHISQTCLFHKQGNPLLNYSCQTCNLGELFSYHHATYVTPIYTFLMHFVKLVTKL